MKINNLTIVPPEGMEAYQEGDEIKFRPVDGKLTYEDIAEKLFKDKIVSVIDNYDNSGIITKMVEDDYNYPVCCTSEKQAKKLLAINKLMNVAKFLNARKKSNASKYSYIYIYAGQLCIGCQDKYHMDVYFNDDSLANEAIQILGEDTIKLALCTDY